MRFVLLATFRTIGTSWPRAVAGLTRHELEAHELEAHKLERSSK